MRFLLLLLFSFYLSISTNAQQKRPIAPSDYYRLQSVSNPQLSPDGKWVLYALSSIDSVKDKRDRDLWMISWDGKENVQLTNGPGSESSAQFSPDGKYISFTASRDGDSKEDKRSQIYLMDRRGGEAKKLTNIKGDIEDYVWKPDGSAIVLVIKDPDYSDTAKTKIRTPYVINRYKFKEDYEGYLDNRKKHLYYFDIRSKKLDTLTSGDHNESDPVFSPDGSKIAFVSNRTADPDRNNNSDIFILTLNSKAPVQQITSWPGADLSPQWSPDGKWIAYLQSSSNKPFTMYGENYLAVVSSEGGAPELLSKLTDRPVRNPRWSNDSRSVYVLMQDDRQCNVVSFDVSDGTMNKITTGDQSFSSLEMMKGNWVTIMSDPKTPGELYAIEKSDVRRLTHVQDSFLAPLQLASVEGFKSRSKDGTIVSGLLYRPSNAVKGQKLPLILYIHGGPVGQDEFAFDLTRQIYASAGYAVAAVNYRGSSGRGIAYTETIFGDWGNKEVMDIIGAADYLIKEGIADENRMGIAGWSYGGISTNYTIATDQRFKAAVSGAGSSLQLSMYGSDEYVNQYENELGVPWKNLDKWLKVSYPFIHADRIKTPTLFMASQSDFNVPVIGAEQMYQALRSMGIPTELIIYPHQNHGLVVPSYNKFRYEKHLEWFGRYLK